MFSKDYLRGIAKESIEISDNGIYTLPDGSVSMFTNDCITKLYRSNQLRDISNVLSKVECDNNCKYDFTESDTISEALKESNGVSNPQLGILVFASAHSPGGGFKNGAMAQEESIAYCSNLYRCQTNFMGRAYYDTNESVRNPIYTNTMLTSCITIFRDSKLDLLKNPVNVTALTAPAVNRGVGIKGHMSSKVLDDAMYLRMKYILYLFAESGCTDIVLGAFGCGVFKNSPITVSQYWYDLLVKENIGRFFDKVTFAVLGSDTARLFKSTFEGLS